jgi:hypothetical protein
MNSALLAISGTVFSIAKPKCLNMSLLFRNHKLNDAWMLYLDAIKLRKCNKDSLGKKLIVLRKKTRSIMSQIKYLIAANFNLL